MQNCKKCGAFVENKRKKCPSCGATMSKEKTNTGGYTQYRGAEELTFQIKFMALCSYIWWLFVIPLIFGRKSQFARAHFNQGFILFLLNVVVAMFDPTGFGLLALWVVNMYCIVRATTGRLPNIPYISQIKILR